MDVPHSEFAAMNASGRVVSVFPVDREVAEIIDVSLIERAGDRIEIVGNTAAVAVGGGLRPSDPSTPRRRSTPRCGRSSRRSRR
jgi:hypothetical protein